MIMFVNMTYVDLLFSIFKLLFLSLIELARVYTRTSVFRFLLFAESCCSLYHCDFSRKLLTVLSQDHVCIAV